MFGQPLLSLQLESAPILSIQQAHRGSSSEALCSWGSSCHRRKLQWPHTMWIKIKLCPLTVHSLACPSPRPRPYERMDACAKRMHICCLSPHLLSILHYQHPPLEVYICYNWWSYTDIALSPPNPSFTLWPFLVFYILWVWRNVQWHIFISMISYKKFSLP